MRRQRYRKVQKPTQNLDSFLDILTNTVGVLTFISLFVTLVAVESSTIVRTPLVSDSNKSAVFFEARNNEITDLEDELVDPKIDALFASLPTCHKPDRPYNYDSYLYDYYLDKLRQYQRCLTEKVEIINSFEVETTFYNVSFVDLDSLMYEPLENVAGESPSQLNATSSQFRQKLSQLNPNETYIAFIVRPDSFQAFRRAREIAWQAGFDVGWEPSTFDNPLVFGSGGRTVGVQ